jgi:hypothetical protein
VTVVVLRLPAGAAVKPIIDRIAEVWGGVVAVWESDSARFVSVTTDDPARAVEIALATKRVSRASAAIATEPADGPLADDRARTRAASFVADLEPSTVVLDEATRRALGPRVLATQWQIGGESVLHMLAWTPERTSTDGPPGAAAVPRRALTLESAVSVVGAFAGLATFAAVVGGATMWARFDAAGISPAHGVAALPRGFLVTQGVRSLLFPLVLGGAAAALVHVLARVPRDRLLIWLRSFVTYAGGRERLTVVLVAFSVALIYAIWKFEADAIAKIIVATFAAVAIAATILRTPRARRFGTALLVFAVVAIWGATVSYFAEAGRKNARLDSTSVYRKGSPRSVDGMLIALTADAVFLANASSDGGCRIVVVPKADVREIDIGRIPGTSCGNLHATGDRAKPPGQTSPIVQTVIRTVTEAGPTHERRPRPTPTPTPNTVTETTTVSTTIARESTTVTVPAGAILLGGTRYSIPIWSVNPPNRLDVASVTVAPATLSRSGEPATMRVTVKDSRGFVVRGALVFVRGLIYGDFTPVDEVTTKRAGVATFRLRPTKEVLRSKRAMLVLFVRARKPGERVTGGVSKRRLVQIPLSR